MDRSAHPAPTPTRYRRSWKHRVIWFLMCVLIAVIWGSLVQTQCNIAALNALGAGIDWRIRLQMSGQDLLGFTPIYAVIVGFGLLGAWPVATWLHARLALRRGHWFAAAGVTGIILAIQLVNALAPPPTLIAATRTYPGLIGMAFGGAIAGWLWFWAAPVRSRDD